MLVLFPFPFPSFPVIKSDTKPCHFFLLYPSHRALGPPPMPVGELQCTSLPDSCSSTELASLIPVSLHCLECARHDRKMNLPQTRLSSSLHQIQTPLPGFQARLCRDSLWLSGLGSHHIHIPYPPGRMVSLMPCPPTLASLLRMTLYLAGFFLTPSPF